MIALLAVLAAGCTSPTGSASDRVPVQPGAPAGAPGASSGPGADPSAGADPGATTGVRPVALRIPAIGVDSRLERLELDGSGELRPPRDPDRAGWFGGGPVPGDVGPAVLAGHVDSRNGPAVFYRLRSLGPGDRIVVERSDGTTVRFEVQSVRRFPRADFPTEDVYGATPEPVLRLITCGGVYDRGSGYRDNVVVFAVPE
ncbi:MAG: class F sortase [Sporichthyaceae bacterium]|nr:class F sortase [Sporichthyaceae bacterium]